jgi:glycerol-3-phosphate dehydrogenase (NAD(P)+)
MSQVLCDAGNHVLMWGRNQDVVDEINSKHTNSKYLDDSVLPVGLRATTDLKEAFDYSNIYVLAIPAQTLRENLNAWKPYVPPNAIYISTLKGIEVSTMSRMTEIIHEVMETENVAIITGPNLANELILRQPAGAVAAAPTMALSEKVQQLFATPYYRVYTSVDVLGCELAGAIKSVIALAVGISIGMGFGENTQAMLITRGLNEVARLCAAHKADPLSAAGLAGLVRADRWRLLGLRSQRLLKAWLHQMLCLRLLTVLELKYLLSKLLPMLYLVHLRLRRHWIASWRSPQRLKTLLDE